MAGRSGAHGLLRASFVPPEPIRVLRDLTRARTTITRARTKEIQRLEKLLEDTGIKLSAVASNIVGVSGRAMLEALIAGQRDSVVLADLAKQRMRQKIPALTEALRGRFTEHHAFMVRLYLDRIDAHTADIARLDARIEEAIAPSTHPGVADEHPGLVAAGGRCVHRRNRCGHERISHRRAPGVVGRVVPGCDESAGRVKSGATRPGNRHLKAALGVAALSAARTKGTYYSIRYRRIAGRRRAAQSRRDKTAGMSIAGQIALVSIEHKMLTDAWNMLTNGAFYRDPGPDYYTRHQPGKAKARAIKQLESLGYKVTLEPPTQAA
ncbi:IS110 family transposase [Mycobacterium noviomagense]|uniref:IS110 family transposase n=1 Tax=Mycobacterium noviomagense TaxID=459858 RepID=A0A7I7PB00_9MYCO|nr:IS110 family transposase [Mycobacterium noviomagense]